MFKERPKSAEPTAQPEVQRTSEWQKSSLTDYLNPELLTGGEYVARILLGQASAPVGQPLFALLPTPRGYYITRDTGRDAKTKAALLFDTYDWLRDDLFQQNPTAHWVRVTTELPEPETLENALAGISGGYVGPTEAPVPYLALYPTEDEAYDLRLGLLDGRNNTQQEMDPPLRVNLAGQ